MGVIMKYKIIPEDVIKNLVEFLDDVQAEAAETKNSPEELQKINQQPMMKNGT